jgi:hypothetical protein
MIAVPACLSACPCSRGLAELQESHQFQYMKGLLLHHAELCPAQRWVGFALTLWEVPPVFELGLEEAALALETFRQAADRTLGPARLPWSVSDRVRVGVTSRGTAHTGGDIRAGSPP